ncbi:DUF1345 domain-containing protein (plasmid) [Hymenobacter sp. BRD128]|uniref:DUF1345 domain-containing protein n=1 Tax=Hymenobacter sp. BRD128 TaxID=2675878 RepID=UPI001566BF13|nr:DUF1345 domain-containing protein [Hymenobacter sp. BRD128]QKG59245.1 DUF1345 domain-containing protein [Hymenobacter sp. BRD128]
MPVFPASTAPSTSTYGLLNWVLRLRALHRVGLALTVSVLCAWLAPADFRTATRWVSAWDGFCVAILALTWLTVFQADAAHIRREATRQDPGRAWTFVAVLLAAGASLFAVALLLRGIKELPHPEQVEQVVVSVIAVLGSWLLLHTLFTLRYAHAYYSEDLTTSPPDKLGGLQFAGAEPTTYWDFAYYAFTIGMTAQTSDTGVTSLQMRQLTLAHGLLSFGFNTAVIALGVNVVSSIL